MHPELSCAQPAHGYMASRAGLQHTGIVRPRQIITAGRQSPGSDGEETVSAQVSLNPHYTTVCDGRNRQLSMSFRDISRFKGRNREIRGRFLGDDVQRTNPDKTVTSGGPPKTSGSPGYLGLHTVWDRRCTLSSSPRLGVGDFEGVDCSFKISSQGVPYQLGQPLTIQRAPIVLYTSYQEKTDSVASIL